MQNFILSPFYRGRFNRCQGRMCNMFRRFKCRWCDCKVAMFMYLSQRVSEYAAQRQLIYNIYSAYEMQFCQWNDDPIRQYVTYRHTQTHKLHIFSSVAPGSQLNLLLCELCAYIIQLLLPRISRLRHLWLIIPTLIHRQHFQLNWTYITRIIHYSGFIHLMHCTQSMCRELIKCKNNFNLSVMHARCCSSNVQQIKALFEIMFK